MFCFRTQRTQRAQSFLLFNAIAGEVAGYARQESAETGGNQWVYHIFVYLPAYALSSRSETYDISSASVNSSGK